MFNSDRTKAIGVPAEPDAAFLAGRVHVDGTRQLGSVRAGRFGGRGSVPRAASSIPESTR